MIKFENVSKSYGKLRALNNINTQISGGKVVGILGPNGSGKTTFLKLIQGYLKPSKGKITVFDHEVGSETKARVSYLPDKPFIPSDYKLKEARDLYKKFFDKNPMEYYIREGLRILIVLAIIMLLTPLINLVDFYNLYLRIGVKFIICLTIPTMILILINWRSEEFQYLLDKVKFIFKSYKDKLKN